MLLLSSLIFLKNLLFWGKIWQIKEYRIDRISDFLKNENGLKILFNKFFLVYLIIFFAYFFIPEDIFIYSVSGIFLAEIFLIFLKIFKKTLIIPKFTGRFSLIFLVSVFLNILLFLQFQNILFLIFLLNFQFLIFGVSIFLTLPVSNFLRNKTISEAKNKISKFPKLKKIGITGSYGKSTVKEFLAQIFEKNFSTISTFKNQNTPLGISDLILNKLDDTFEYFFAEMGAYKKGEIRELGEIVDHKYGFLTGINNQHLSLFGSQSNIVLGKSEIAEKVAKNGGVLYVNGDNFYCKKAVFPKDLKLVFYGLNSIFNSAFSEILKFTEKGVSFDFFYKGEKTNFTTKIIGKHNISNLTGVLAFAFDQGISAEKIQESLNSLKTPEKNLELIKKSENVLFIDDTYNSNFDGVISACESLEIFENYEKILILDDILELGEESEKIHFELGKEISKFDFREIYLIGKNFRQFVKKGLLKNNFSEEKIFFEFGKKVDKNKKIFLFEGRNSEKYLNKILD